MRVTYLIGAAIVGSKYTTVGSNRAGQPLGTLDDRLHRAAESAVEAGLSREAVRGMCEPGQ
jgi:hypothetical protein